MAGCGGTRSERDSPEIVPRLTSREPGTPEDSRTLSAWKDPTWQGGRMSLLLRPFRDSDAGSTREVFEAAIRGTAAAYYTPEQIDAWCPATHDPQAWAAARARAWTIVAEVDDRVVGFSDLRDDGELDMLFVAPEAGGRGVARALVAEVLAEARRRQLSRVTTRASRAARPAFERFGFVVDRPNEKNIVRGVAVPNFEMHIDLPRPRH